MEFLTNKIKTFTFLDESGVFLPKLSRNINHFGLGCLKHPSPFELNQKLHQQFENLCSILRKDETRVEFSFKSITSKSFDVTMQLLEALLEDENWEFNCLYFDTEDGKFAKPQDANARWESYVSFVKMLIKNNLWRTEETILVADYLRKPKTSRKKFEFITIDIPQVYNLLQVESHGVLLLQVADLLLGSFLYSLGDFEDKEGNKKRISQKVLEMKRKVGKERFNVWKVDWSR